MVRHGHADTRAAIWELRARALESGGLLQALEELLPLAVAGSGLKIEIQATSPERPLPAHIEHHLLRIAQEAVTNSLKHAQATLASVSVDYQVDQVRLILQDNGVGFVVNHSLNPDQPSFGLVGMRERAAKLGGALSIQSRPSHGTRIEVIVPLQGTGMVSGKPFLRPARGEFQVAE